MQLRSSHPELKGQHAFLAPSDTSWPNYEQENLDKRFYTAQAAAHGTRLHEFAAEAIALRMRMPDLAKTMNLFVNDSIGYKMYSELMLFYSFNCFGTADSLGFREELAEDGETKIKKLRVFDLKSGTSRTSPVQLFSYCAIFCLEYGFKPSELKFECRIYKSDKVEIYEPDWTEILQIMEKIKDFDDRLEYLKTEVR